MDQTKTIILRIDSSQAVTGGKAAQQALEAIEAQTASLSQSLDKFQATISGTFSTIKNTILGALSFEAVKTQIDQLTQSFDKLGSRAANLGVSTDWLQTFEYAAASSSVKLDAATTALDKFARTVGEAA